MLREYRNKRRVVPTGKYAADGRERLAPLQTLLEQGIPIYVDGISFLLQFL